jgi:hypothetical protein
MIVACYNVVWEAGNEAEWNEFCGQAHSHLETMGQNNNCDDNVDDHTALLTYFTGMHMYIYILQLSVVVVSFLPL